MKKIYVVVIDYITGCESDARSTVLIKAFPTKEKANEALPEISKSINWNNYYEGELDIEEIDFVY